MDPSWLVGISLLGYGTSLMVGMGIPIPVLDEEIMRYTAVRDRDILAPVVDYSRDYPSGEDRIITRVNYEELRKGKITVEGRTVPTVPLSSYAGARKIAEILKNWIAAGEFTLSRPSAPLPGPNSEIKLKI